MTDRHDLSLDETPLLREWLLMCATNAEFVGNYNRLTGAAISFDIPDRTRIERMVDAATGHIPQPVNEPGEMSVFLRFCIDCYARLPLPA